MRPKIIISCGDVNGIGPEIILKSLPDIKKTDSQCVIIGPKSIFEFYAQLLNLDFKPNAIIKSIEELKLVDNSHYLILLDFSTDYQPQPGKVDQVSGHIALKSFEIGTACALGFEQAALVTAPISKTAVYKAGFVFPGHTEYLAFKTDVSHPLMVLMNENIKVALQTIHVALREVPNLIKKAFIVEYLKIFNRFLKDDLAINSPQIAVFGLNPHAGEEGSMGSEEIDEIIPAIAEALDLSINIEGPFPADSFFGAGKHLHYDGILAMYHDQGLAPFKALSFHNGVNVTAGLPIIRTSPDHGTAFEIAGKAIAKSDSFFEAYLLALRIIINRLEAKLN